MAKKLQFTRQQKRRFSLIGGIAGFVLGAWYLFYLQSKLGFVFAIIGITLLLMRWK